MTQFIPLFKRVCFLLVAPLIFSIQLVSAATVNVDWVSPEKYRDVHAGEGFQEDYQSSVFYNLNKHFQKLGNKLPADHTLKIKVENLVLAGDVHSGGIDLIRIIENMYPPKIEFTYQYVDSKNHVLLTNKVSYRDPGFMTRGSNKYRGHYLNYEKSLLDRWFKKEFLKALEHSNKKG